MSPKKPKSPIEGVSAEFLITREFQTAQEFSVFIERKAVQRKISLMEALLEYCEDRDVDPSAVSALITPALKKRIQCDAEQLHLLKPNKHDRT